MNTKICSVCDTNKSISLFQKDSSKKDGYRPDCKECRKAYYLNNRNKIKKYQEENKEKIKNFNKNYYLDNKEKILENKLKYWKENKEKIQKYQEENKEKISLRRNKYLKNKYKNDSFYKLKRVIRSLVSGSLKNKKSKKTEEILGCSMEFFYEYIENKFADGMSYENHGQSKFEKKWQIDHIIPISLAKNENDLIMLNHYTNFQPLWEFENKIKSNKLDFILQMDLNLV